MTSTTSASTKSESAVHATVSYADVFDMPIEVGDLHRFLIGVNLSEAQTNAAVDRLVERHQLVRVNGVVHLPGRDAVVDIYHDRTERAATMWRQAEVWGRRIGRVPFVRMVAVTGGLAVDSVADHDDIDFFIVTRPGRLWLTRLLIIVLGRIAASRGVELCPNYLVSEDAITMTDHSVYVARELAQMVPIVGPTQCSQVRHANHWMFEFLPNATIDGDLTHASSQKPHPLQRLAERVLALPVFAPLERWEMDRKIVKLTKVASRRPEVGSPDESSFSPSICKGHMVGNAAGIDAAWRTRLDGFDVG